MLRIGTALRLSSLLRRLIRRVENNLFGSCCETGGSVFVRWLIEISNTDKITWKNNELQINSYLYTPPSCYVGIYNRWGNRNTKPHYVFPVMVINGVEWRLQSKWDAAVVGTNTHFSLSHKVYSLIPAGVWDASGIWWNILLLLWERNWWGCLSLSLSTSLLHIGLSFKAPAGYPSDYFACCYS